MAGNYLYCKPLSAADLRERIIGMTEGCIAHFASGDVSLNSIRVVISHTTLSMPDRGFMSKRVGDTIILCRYA